MEWGKIPFLYQLLPRLLTNSHFSVLPSLHGSCTHAILFPKLVLCQAHTFANLSDLPALTVIEESVILIQQIGDIDFQQLCNPAELAYWVVVMSRTFIVNIGVFIDPCILSNFPLEQGFFIPVISQLVRRRSKHRWIGITDMELLCIGKFCRT